ncbi:hypothetical protein CABS01_12420 [Colletotrichum abscissum]|uniref:uncharacterized protein n=1 Tax=Colletotrichum abscissum TaxID=1671311 RepID=UPI0027D4B853|nr:uncharacterized protein CABS01_12420 [Colletotrichum abscissum]KAK1490620.1 hypothetical protein CABS01_12420 [Colletotrichum abscissum]
MCPHCSPPGALRQISKVCSIPRVSLSYSSSKWTTNTLVSTRTLYVSRRDDTHTLSHTHKCTQVHKYQSFPGAHHSPDDEDPRPSRPQPVSSNKAAGFPSRSSILGPGSPSCPAGRGTLHARTVRNVTVYTTLA